MDAIWRSMIRHMDDALIAMHSQVVWTSRRSWNRMQSLHTMHRDERSLPAFQTSQEGSTSATKVLAAVFSPLSGVFALGGNHNMSCPPLRRCILPNLAA